MWGIPADSTCIEGKVGGGGGGGGGGGWPQFVGPVKSTCGVRANCSSGSEVITCCWYM